MQSTRIAINRNYDLYSERLISYVEYPVRSTTEATSLLKGARARALQERTKKYVIIIEGQERKKGYVAGIEWRVVAGLEIIDSSCVV